MAANMVVVKKSLGLMIRNFVKAACGLHGSRLGATAGARNSVSPARHSGARKSVDYNREMLLT